MESHLKDILANMAILSSKILEKHELGDYFGVDSSHIREQVAAVVVEIVTVVVFGVVAVAGIDVGIAIADIAEDIP